MARGTQARRPDVLATAAFAAAFAAGGCASRPPPRTQVPTAPAVAAAETTPAAKPAPARRPCAPTDREYEAWFDRTFGRGAQVFHDGPDPARIRTLVGEPRLEAESMLRRGLAACSMFAVFAIRGAGWRDLVPDLTRAVAADDAEFRAHVIVALKVLEGRADFTDELIAVLSSRSSEARMTAAMGARHFSIERLRRPLLDRVRQDTSWLVRVHAAESLYELADVYPRDLGDHPAISAAVHGDSAKKPSPLEFFGIAPQLTADQRARLAIAADQIDAEITERLAAGRCSKPVRLTMDDLHIVPVDERPIVTLTIDERIGPCERELAFVAFVESPGGFSSRHGHGVHGSDPITFEIAALPKPVPGAYSRATGMLTIGALKLDTAKVNGVLLSTGRNGVVVRYQGKLDLTFGRHGRVPSPTGMAFFDYRPEIAAAIRALLERTPELRALVRGATAGDGAPPARRR